ncbi:sentrin-specific protease 6-like isoform X1 [Pomacea canaliculata]|uniref:sentrin-specific protease 6-like isoform X1 n=1 Tax=Pomacea canaliculata TaxID=400727 RepID=UPI000D733E91|nr:sentrin-specific protease 6-like isoform X1 [Pomacea canaliculata]
MSFLDALADTENRADRGWSYSNRYNSHDPSGHTSVYNNSSRTIDHWPSPAQHHAMSIGSAPSSAESFAHEQKNSDTDDDIVLVDDSAITISEDRTPQNHKPTSSYSSPFSNHVSHNLPSHHHHQVRMLKQLNSPIPVVQSLHTPQHQSAHPQCLALVAHKVPVTQHSLAGEQQAMKGPHHGQLQVDQQGDHARTVPHKVEGSQRLAMEPLQRPLRDHQQQQLMNSQPVPSSNQQRHNMQVKLSTCQSHSPLPENCNSGGQGTKYCLQQQQQQHGVRKDHFHLQHRNRESQQQLQHHAQLSTVSTEQQNASVQRCDSFIIKPDVCGSTDSRTHCVPQSLVSKEAYPQTVRINSTPQHINAVDLQSLPRHCFQVVGNGNLQSFTTYGLKLPDGATQVAVWNGSQMIIQEPLSQLSSTNASIAKAWLATNDRADHSQVHSRPQGGQLASGLHPAADQNSVDTPLLGPRKSATNAVWPTPMPSRKPPHSESNADTLPESPVPDLEMRSSDSKSSIDSNMAESSPSGFAHSSVHKNTILPAEHIQDKSPSVSSSAAETSETLRIKSNLKEDEEAVAVCRYCGYSSSDFERCESCRRKFSENVKIVVNKRSAGDAGLDQLRIQTSPSSGPEAKLNRSVIDKKSFYKGRQLSSETPSSKMTPGKEGTHQSSSPSPRGRGGRRGKTGTSPRKPARSKKIKDSLKEPVTLTISSDEDEPAHKSTPEPSSLRNKDLSQEMDEDGLDISPFVNAMKPTSFGKSRRERMEDEAGRCFPNHVDEMDISQSTRPMLISVRGVRVGSLRSTAVSVHFLEDQINFEIVSDRTGEEFHFEVPLQEIMCIQYTLSQLQPVAFIKVIPACGVRLRERLKMTLKGPEYFDPASYDLQKSFIVIIIDEVINEDGLREILKSYKVKHPQAVPDFLRELPYDDANSLLVNSSPPVLKDKGRHSYHVKPDTKNCKVNAKVVQNAQALFSSTYGKGKTISVGDIGDSSITEEVGKIEVPQQEGDKGKETVVPLLREEKMASRSPSPTVGFVGPIEKLLTYPPPPAKGGITITNEDLYCLNEGEFLNDVILDFYLKYLVREKLSEEDRQRTHVFSSFFYKRLMQRQSRSSHDVDDAKLTPAQKRHTRVKTWTRHVDIFSKDFLLVPINEHSHWYLAVICFPGLASLDYVPYQPSATSEEEAADPTNEVESSQSSPREEQSPSGEDKKEESMDVDASSCKSILGKIIDQEAVGDNISFSIGQKQACILILDSLAGPPRNSVIRTLKEYLQVEWDLKKSLPRNMAKTIRGAVPKVPQQTNFSDCGVFVLQYAETFFENPIASYAIPMKGLEKWFPLNKVEKKREEIRNLILQLQNECR